MPQSYDFGKQYIIIDKKLNKHITSKNNPHEVTKAQIGLGNVENYSPEDMPLSNVATEEIERLDKKINDEVERAEATEQELSNYINREAEARIAEDIQLHKDIEEVAHQKEGRTTRIYDSIETMINDLNTLDIIGGQAGDNVYFTGEELPALWIAKVEETHKTYQYVDDETFINAVNNNLERTVQVGYFKIFKVNSNAVRSDINYITIEDAGQLNLELKGNQIATFTSDEITALTLTTPAEGQYTMPYYSEVIFLNSQVQEDYTFSVINNTGKQLHFIQWAQSFDHYSPKTMSSRNATIDLLFAYNGLDFVCYINEIPH